MPQIVISVDMLDGSVWPNPTNWLNGFVTQKELVTKTGYFYMERK